LRLTTAMAVIPYFAIVGQLNMLDQRLCLLVASVFSLSCVSDTSEPRASGERGWRVIASAAARRWQCEQRIAEKCSSAARSRSQCGGRAICGIGGDGIFLFAFTPPFSFFARLTDPGVPRTDGAWFIVVSRGIRSSSRFLHPENFQALPTPLRRIAQGPWWLFRSIHVAPRAIYVASIPHGAREAGFSGRRHETMTSVIASALLWSWWCACLMLFFSISHSKLPRTSCR